MIVELVLAAAAAVPVISCQDRIEGPRPIGPSLPLDLTVGPITFVGLRYAQYARPAQVTRSTWKAASVVEYGPAVTLVVPPADRPHMKLGWTSGTGYALILRPCHPATRAHAYPGPVGKKTAWPFGFVLDGPGCRHLEVRVAGRAPVQVAIPFAGRCP